MAAFCHLLKFSLWLHMVSFLPYMFYRSLKVTCVYYYYWNTVMCVCVYTHTHIHMSYYFVWKYLSLFTFFCFSFFKSLIEV